MTNIRSSDSGAIYVNAFGQDTDASTRAQKAARGSDRQAAATAAAAAAAAAARGHRYPSCSADPKLPGDALLRVRNISICLRVPRHVRERENRGRVLLVPTACGAHDLGAVNDLRWC